MNRSFLTAVLFLGAATACISAWTPDRHSDAVEIRLQATITDLTTIIYDATASLRTVPQ
jgi:hypothetical protein